MAALFSHMYLSVRLDNCWCTKKWTNIDIYLYINTIATTIIKPTNYRKNCIIKKQNKLNKLTK